MPGLEVALASSRVVGMARACVRGAARSAEQASVTAAIAAARRGWLAQAHYRRHRFAGTALIVAAITHVVLAGIPRPPVGWMWIVPSALAATIGVVMLAAVRGKGLSARV